MIRSETSSMFYKHRLLLAYHLIAIAFLESITVDSQKRINDAFYINDKHSICVIVQMKNGNSH